jgi:hypothetical protein
LQAMAKITMLKKQNKVRLCMMYFLLSRLII